MGWLRAPLLDFIHLCILAKKKINTTLIYFMFFFSSSELDRPEIILFALPLRPLPVAHPVPSLLRLTVLFG